MKINLNPNRLINKRFLPYIQALQARQIYFGGSSSGKSVYLAQRAVLDVLQGRNYLIARNVARTINKSVWNEALKAIYSLGVSHLFNIGKAEMIITAKNNGKQILFVGLDDVEKVKSITPMVGALTDIWIEEATEIAYEDYKQLEKRIRGLSKHSKRITLSFNPVYQTHWIYKEFFGNWDEGETTYNDGNLLIVKSTHKDNEFLTADDHNALENEKDEYFYNVYTLGNWGVLGDVIFRNWKTEDLYAEVDIGGRTMRLVDTFDNIRNGLDFGFSSDPAAIVRVHLDKMRKRIYIFKEGGGRGLTNKLLSDEIKELGINTQVITCDSAEPKSIQELRGYNINAHAALKGADSVVYGIQWLQGYEIIVDVRCQNIKNELTTYQWKQDKDGNAMRIPVDKDNHWLDALRYSLERDMAERKMATVKIY